jgi:transcriptional regulator with XRE-family HTH domain
MRRIAKDCPASVERLSHDHAATDRRTRRGPAKTRACSPAMSDLGRAIRGLRGERKVSIEALALAADIHPTYLSSIERGLRNPSWWVLCSLARALRISIVDLARRVESAERVRKGVERVLEDERARLAGASVGLVQESAA